MTLTLERQDADAVIVSVRILLAAEGDSARGKLFPAFAAVTSPDQSASALQS